MPVFISGPIRTLTQGVEHFSRILSLSTWSICADKNIFSFINVFY